MNTLSRLAAALALLGWATCHAQGACSSDGQRPPAALLERFISADCAECWRDRQTPDPTPGTLAVDWIVPAASGDDAPLSVAATREALERMAATGRHVDGRTPTTAYARVESSDAQLRVAHGPAYNGYVGVSVDVRTRLSGRWTTWLLLVETLPVGEEGSPVERRLVRGALTLEGAGPADRPRELRAMRIPDGAQPDRLQLVGWVEDERRAVRALAQSRCE